MDTNTKGPSVSSVKSFKVCVFLSMFQWFVLTRVECQWCISFQVIMELCSRKLLPC